MDPFRGAAALITGLIKAHRLDQWVKLLITMVWSYLVSLSSVTGGLLAAGNRPSLAIGAGMVSGAVAVAWLWMQSPLTKGLMVAVPATMDVFSQEVKGIEHDK